VDVNEAIGKHVEAVAYAWNQFTSPVERNFEIRLGSFTAFKLWVNGELVMTRGDAYTGMRLDHYVARAHLKAGKNSILLTMAQDDPPPPLPKIWRFMLRVCDEGGVALLSGTRPAPTKKT